MKSTILTFEFQWRGIRFWFVRAEMDGRSTHGVVFDNEGEASEHHASLALIAAMPPHHGPWEHLTDPTGFTWKRVPGPQPGDIEEVWPGVEDDATA